MKLLKKIIIILIVLSIVSLIVLNIIGKNVKEDKLYEKEEQTKQELKDSFLGFSNATYLFSAYNGKIRTTNITKEIENFITQYLPEIYFDTQNLNSDNITKYYNENKEKIKKMDIETEKNFMEIVKFAQSMKEDLKQYDECVIDKESFSNEDTKYFNFKFKIIYKNGKTVDFKMKVINQIDNKDDSMFLFETI